MLQWMSIGSELMRVNALIGAPMRSGTVLRHRLHVLVRGECRLGDDLGRGDRALAGTRMPTDLRQLLHGSPLSRIVADATRTVRRPSDGQTGHTRIRERSVSVVNGGSER